MTIRSLRGRNLVVAIVVGLVAVVGAGFLVGRPAWNGRCAAGFDEMPSKELGQLHSVPVDQVNVDDFPEAYRPNARRVLEVAKKPVAPLGAARDAVVVPHEYGVGSARLADSDDGNVRFVIGAGDLKGMATSGGIVQVDGETGRPAWGRGQAGYALGGGGLSDQFLLTHIPNDKAPRVAAVNTSNGDLAWCTKLGKDVETGWRPTFDSAAKGDALFTVRGSDSEEKSDRDVRLSRLDTGSGEVSWDVPVKGVIQADSVHLLGDQVLLNPLHTDMDDQTRARILTQEHDQPVRDRGALVARSVADGAASWTYRGPDERPWINNVVGTGKDVAVVISRRPVKDGNKPWSTETWMVGLDRTGKQLWKYDFKNQYDYDLSRSFLVTDDLVVSQEKDGEQNTSLLVARELATGEVRWRTRFEDGGPRLGSNASSVLGDSLLAASFTGGLIAVDLKTGALSNPLPGKNIGPVDGLVSDGRTVTIDVNGLFITFDRAF
ncbi:putative pyrroloquinoline-quinone binding quinoprotein [Kribbella sp. VKM Ac-2569]|uniref:outer membrane protein assembly factor BamB family protein n=1 Tax=Kribbella sp. VKM Ac-2569 TaxID=2512220 RepID=UPI00102AF8D3|nr:PQQ-binding-like beta-propeller repeat protein [Kribbella sp. VKM Ac-2569]RZT28198.1 putative pyrroloquinoline-quinone binding quinoprotein [Kribbella sp. VKM Ac-2569]